MTILQYTLQSIAQAPSRFGIRLNRGASQSEMDAFEVSMNLKLPEDLREFYAFSNGFSSEEDLFNMIPLHEILAGTFKFH